MISIFLATQSVFAIAVAARARRAAVLRRLALSTPESGPISLLSRSLSTHSAAASRLERMVASKVAMLVRSLVHTSAFELTVLSAVVRFRATVNKKAGMR